MDLSTSLCILLAILIPIWIYWNRDPKRSRIAKFLNKLPGPIALPVIGTSYRFIGVSRQDLSKNFKEVIEHYKPIFRMWNAHHPEAHLTEADHIQTILRSSVNITKSFTYEYLKPWLGTGLLTSTGNKWFVHRKIITPAFHFKILVKFQEIFAEKTQILVRKLEAEVGNTNGFDISPYISRCTLDIICETAMGTKINAQEHTNSAYVAAVDDMSGLILHRLVSPWLHSDFLYSFTKEGKRFNECRNILHGFTNKVIYDRKQSRKSKPRMHEDTETEILGKQRRIAFLDLLLEASEDAALSDEDIHEEVDTFMLGGQDTTFAALSWALLLLGNHLDVQERVFEEQKSIFQESDRKPNIEDLADMKYLEQVIKECLRLYPSVPIIGRQLTEDAKAGEYTLPEGCHIFIHIYYAHRNPEYFPDPETFNPDNFLPEKVQGSHPYTYIPFSAGPRNCIGQKFALQEEKTVLSALIRNFRIRALDLPCDITPLAELVLRPADGVRLVIERR